MNHSIDIQVDDDLIDQVDQTDLSAAIAHALQVCQQTGTLTLVITGNTTVQQLNRDYRGIDAPTDVLSFANHDAPPMAEPVPIIQGLPTEVVASMQAYLGDIIVAYPYAIHQAETYQNSIGAELRLLAVHGLLHLLGYDHGTVDDEAEMWSLQSKILAHFGDAHLSNRVYE